MKYWRYILPVCAFFLMMWGGIAFAQESETEQKQPGDLVLIDAGKVKEIIKSDLIMLDNGKRYRLANIRIPLPYDAMAQEEMKREFLNKKVTVYTYYVAPSKESSSKKIDRTGAQLAQVIGENGVLMQAELISKGWAWVFSTPATSEMVTPLKEIEAKARDQKLGFWSNEAYSIKTPDNIQEYLNTFQIVEGKITNVETKRYYTFFNFGTDWKTDYTIRVLKKDWGRFSLWYAPVNKAEENLWPNDPQKWKNKTVRIRGWVEDNDGPMIALTHPEQIDVIEETPKK